MLCAGLLTPHQQRERSGRPSVPLRRGRETCAERAAELWVRETCAERAAELWVRETCAERLSGSFALPCSDHAVRENWLTQRAWLE
jgi:hypothetical protein